MFLLLQFFSSFTQKILYNHFAPKSIVPYLAYTKVLMLLINVRLRQDCIQPLFHKISDAL